MLQSLVFYTDLNVIIVKQMIFKKLYVHKQSIVYLLICLFINFISNTINHICYFVAVVL